MNIDRAEKIVHWGVMISVALCLIGAIVELITRIYLIYPIFALVALAIMLHCYVVGKESFPEWSKKP